MLKIFVLTSLLFFCIGGLAQANDDLRNISISKTSHSALCAVQSTQDQILTGSITPTITSLGGGNPGEYYGPGRLYIFFSAKDFSGKQLNYNLVLQDTGGPWIWIVPPDTNGDFSVFGDTVSASAVLYQIDEPDVFLKWKPYTYLGEVNISTCQ